MWCPGAAALPAPSLERPGDAGRRARLGAECPLHPVRRPGTSPSPPSRPRHTCRLVLGDGLGVAQTLSKVVLILMTLIDQQQ